MLRILALIVFSLVLLEAKVIPLVQSITIYIPVKKFSVIEFPFVVKEKRFTPFEYKTEIQKTKKDPLSEKTALPKLPALPNGSNKPANTLDKIKKSFVGNTAPKGVLKASWGKNFVQLYPALEGKTEVIIWGYKKYPILLNLIASKDKTKTDTYIKFIDYDKEFKEKNRLKNLSHEKICSRLIYFLYNNKTPSGYKLETDPKEYKSKNLHFVETKRIIGRFYTATQYKVTNISDKKLKLNEPMFASNLTYAISIVNRDLNPGETTSLFIVSPTVRR